MSSRYKKRLVKWLCQLLLAERRPPCGIIAVIPTLNGIGATSPRLWLMIGRGGWWQSHETIMTTFHAMLCMTEDQTNLAGECTASLLISSRFKMKEKESVWSNNFKDFETIKFRAQIVAESSRLILGAGRRVSQGAVGSFRM